MLLRVLIRHVKKEIVVAFEEQQHHTTQRSLLRHMLSKRRSEEVVLEGVEEYIQFQPLQIHLQIVKC
jgi:hypothetical protein